MRFLSIKDAASLLLISQPTLYRWVHERRIPYRKHGGRLVFAEADLIAWSDSQKTEPLPETPSWTASVPVKEHSPRIARRSLTTEIKRESHHFGSE